MNGTNARLLGITDEVTTCDCCGKTNLKRTLAISLDGESDAVHFGSTCGAQALAGRGYKLKGPQLERRAEKLAYEVRMRDRYVAALEQVEAKMKAGQVRWLIGGVEKGAPLAELAGYYRRDVEFANARISGLETL